MRRLSTLVRSALLLALVAGGLSGCSSGSAPNPMPTVSASGTSRTSAAADSRTPTPARSATPAPAPPSRIASPRPTARSRPPASGYPWHTDIVSTTFWVGEVFDPNASDGSQVVSTYDSRWQQHYGGCDGLVVGGTCTTERRTAVNGYFPTAMTPKQNPFYLDLPFDDVNDLIARSMRTSVVPWANRPGYAALAADPAQSLMKNRWVEIQKGGRTCFGQIEDAGPGQYHDAAYVFGHDDARPVNQRYGGAGMDVSPALNGCLGFADLNGDTDRVSWRFVDRAQVPPGPWLRLVTTSPAS